MTKIERLNPALGPLLEEIGGGAKIAYRGGDWWLLPWDHQITYGVDTRDGGCRGLDTRGKSKLAEELLGWVIDARKKWGTLLERAETLLAEMEKVRPSEMWGQSPYCREWSMDELSAFGPRGLEVTMTLKLVGEEKLEVYGETLKAAVVAMRAAVGKKFGS